MFNELKTRVKKAWSIWGELILFQFAIGFMSGHALVMMFRGQVVTTFVILFGVAALYKYQQLNRRRIDKILEGWRESNENTRLAIEGWNELRQAVNAFIGPTKLADGTLFPPARHDENTQKGEGDNHG